MAHTMQQMRFQFCESPILPTIRLDAGEIVRAWDIYDNTYLQPQFCLNCDFDDHPWLSVWWDCQQPVTHLRIYHDGSHCDQGAGAAAIAFLYQPGRGWTFGGALAIAHIDSYGADLRGALLALQYGIDILKIIALVQAAPPEFSMMHDNITVGNQALGRWDAKADASLAALVRHLTVYSEHRFAIRILAHHVAAHTGEVGNEIADNLAGRAAQGNPISDLSHWLALTDDAQFRQHAAWFWLLYNFQICTWWDGDDLCLPQAAQTTPPINVLPCSLSETAGSVPENGRTSGVVDLIVGTCNVLTLKSSSKRRPAETDIGITGPTRQQIVFSQFKGAQVCIFALQETRLRRMSPQFEDYLIYKGDATPQGHHGVLAAISTTIPYGHYVNSQGRQCKLYFTKHDISVICTGARYVLLRICTPWLRCVLIAAHAPHSGNTVEVLDQWWTSSASLVPSRLADWPVLLLVDANARVGADSCNLIGDLGAEKGDEKALPFTSCVRSHGIWLPSTFNCHQGPSGTWRHPNGHWLRSDSVGLPTFWMGRSCTSWVADNIDVALHHEDHRAALVHITMEVASSPHNMRRATPKFTVETADLTALRTAENIGPGIDVHSHALLLQQQVAACLPRQRARGPVQSKTSGTWELVLQKRQWRQALWKAKRFKKRPSCMPCSPNGARSPSTFLNMISLLLRVPFMSYIG